MELLKIEDLTFTYPTCDEPAVSHISFAIQDGEFTVICGATGSGKSTLLRLLKQEIAPNGEKTGVVKYGDLPMEQLPAKERAAAIGFVGQNPEQQIVTDKVWHELSFGLENLGFPQKVIARQVAETASYFGMESWYDKSVSALSGGQKQLLNLASVMVMQPRILVLDEPTAQLDPIAAADFMAALKKINLEFGTAIILVEHRLEEVIPLCDRLLLLENGQLLDNGVPREVIERMQGYPKILSAMPAAVRLYHALGAKGTCPLTVREGRQWIKAHYSNHVLALPQKEYKHSHNKALEFREVSFRYQRDLPDVLQATEFTVYENEIFCILGGNGSGKTTALHTAAGLLKAYSGTVRIFEKKIKDYQKQELYRQCLTLLPQNVQTVFLKNTVREELEEVGADALALPFELTHLYEKHPYDLSGGEQQLVALAKVLAAKPRLLLMDEPTKGLDANKKADMIAVLKQLKQQGITVVIVTHDVEFSALCADRCALFFRGRAVSVDTPERFFSQNRFYTTAASRMSRDYYDRAVTVEQLFALCTQNGEKAYADNTK